MVGITTARGTWTTLERMFASTSHARAMLIRMELATIQKKDLSITEYFRKVKRLGDTLAAIGKKLEDDELIAYMLQGLGSEYDSLVMSITTRTDVYTISDVYAHMLSSKMRYEHNGMIIHVSSANNVNRTGGRTSDNSSRGGRGHGRAGNGGHGPGGRGGPSRSPNKNGNGGQLCQICFKGYHSALKCWHRFDQAYQHEDHVKQAAAVTHGYAVDPNWYVDTGVTDHITNDLECLTMKERYAGGDKFRSPMEQVCQYLTLVILYYWFSSSSTS
jgi:hypothetical protein